MTSQITSFLNKNYISILWVLGFYIAVCLASVKVSVYYETLCPDSINFITNQLHPTYDEFGGIYIKLDLIPYGFTKESIINGTSKFTCQHGPAECYGNKVHGCIIQSQSINVTEGFMFCAEKANAPTSTKTFKDCAKKHGISWSNIEHNCYDSGLAEKILRRNGEKTKLIQPKWIPTIVFNDSFNEYDSEEAQTNFKAVVCMSSISKARKEQLHPAYKEFGDEYIDLELIPYGNIEETVHDNCSTSYSCQHGSAECYGNLVHGCVIYSPSISMTVLKDSYFVLLRMMALLADWQRPEEGFYLRFGVP